jgi:ElaB/YqjD/DUF883 family membrane-anchored ribosome-binding protein
MFDFDKEEMMEETTTMGEFEWEKITEKHADQEHTENRDAAIKAEGKREAFCDFYEKRYRHRKDHIAVNATRYGLAAAAAGALSYLVRIIPWLAITMAAVALIFGLLCAFGIGKYSEM